MRGAVQQGAARFAAVPLQGLNLRAQAQLRYLYTVAQGDQRNVHH